MSQSSHDVEVESIAEELERYITCNPAPADTIDGIARWWLTRVPRPSMPKVELAVVQLVLRRVLTRRQLPDGSCVYGRAGPLVDS